MNLGHNVTKKLGRLVGTSMLHHFAHAQYTSFAEVRGQFELPLKSGRLISG